MLRQVAKYDECDKTLRNAWMVALRDGNRAFAEDLIYKKDLSPSYSPSELGGNPLVFLALQDTHCKKFRAQAELAELLIDGGCELKIPDIYNMVPADYAMLSKNTEAATIIVRETMVRNSNPAKPYIPNVDGYFATMCDENDRKARFGAMLYNHNDIRETFISDVRVGLDPEIASCLIDNDVGAYWNNPLKLDLSDLPEPSEEFTQVVNKRPGLVSAEEAMSAQYRSIIRELGPVIKP